MKLYEKSFLVDIIESKLLDTYPDYYPQGQCNNIFIEYLYKYIIDNSYSDTHISLHNKLLKLKEYSDTLSIVEDVNNKSFILSDKIEISSVVKSELEKILLDYPSYEYDIYSSTRISFTIKFGWLPQSSTSFLNLLDDDNLINYHIDGTNLVPNTNDTSYLCYKINIREYQTILFLIDDTFEFSDNTEITVASLLTELEGTKGATLNRVKTIIPQSFFYEIGPYNDNYVSTEKSSIIIQIPYNYAVSSIYNVYDVTAAVKILDDWFVSLDDYNIIDKNVNSNKFILTANEIKPFTIFIEDSNKELRLNVHDDGKGNLIDDSNIIVGSIDYSKANFALNLDNIVYPLTVKYTSLYKFNYNLINTINMFDSENIIKDDIIRYVLGDFIWKTSEAKLIKYAENLINAVIEGNINFWSKVKTFKQQYKTSSVEDDCIDIYTEQQLRYLYKQLFNKDPNLLFNEW